jgi:hypothetical protein
MLSLAAAEGLGSAAQEAAQIARDNTVRRWDEEDITEEFVDNLVDELNDASMKHLIAADSFSKINPKAESAVGADFLFVVVYASQAAITSWGFLSQAKYYANAVNQSNAKTRLAEQCETMQQHTPSSFANIYYDDSYRFFSASQIAADSLVNTNLELEEMSKKFSNRATRQFFKEVFYGLWGDRWVAEHADQLLNANKPDEVPDRAVATDGGENSPTKWGVVTIIKDQDVEYSVLDELDYENVEIFSDAGI